MVTNLLLDFSRVLLFPKDNTYSGLLNDLYRKKIIEEKHQFLDYFRFNEELLAFLQTIKEKYNLSLYTTDIIQNDPASITILDPIFEKAFVAHDLGISKKDPKGYLVIADKLEVDPQEIVFIDDTSQNIQAARQAGLKTIQYSTNEQLLKNLQVII